MLASRKKKKGFCNEEWGVVDLHDETGVFTSSRVYLEEGKGKEKIYPLWRLSDDAAAAVVLPVIFLLQTCISMSLC